MSNPQILVSLPIYYMGLWKDRRPDYRSHETSVSTVLTSTGSSGIPTSWSKQRKEDFCQKKSWGLSYLEMGEILLVVEDECLQPKQVRKQVM